MKPQRIYIVGVTCTGKSTLAPKLAKKIKAKHYDLDEFFFKKKYDVTRTKKEMAELVEKTMKKKKWVIEGSYSKSSWVKSVAKRADIVIWLNIPTPKLAYRITKRGLTKQKPHPKHSRKKEIIELLKFVRRYNKNYSKYHKHISEKHPKGYILKNNRQINKFLRDFNKIK